MILLKVSFFDVAIPVLLVSIVVILAIIGFRRLRVSWGIGQPVREKYAVLYSMEKQPVVGEVELYYELEEPKEVEIWLLDKDMNDHTKVDSRAARMGGNKVKLNTTIVENGRYFYELRSDNQKTSKAIYIEN